MTAVNICREHDCACQEVAPSRRCGTCPERPREAAGTPDNSVLIRLRRPEGYEDVHPELLLADARIHPAFDAEIVAAAPPAAVPSAPTGLLDRVKAAEQRVQDNSCPRRIPADPHGDVDLVLAEVRYWLEGRWPPFWIAAAPAAPEGDTNA